MLPVSKLLLYSRYCTDGSLSSYTFTELVLLHWMQFFSKNLNVDYT